MSRLHKILACSLLVCLASVVWAGEAGEVVYVAGSVAGGVDARTPLAIGAKVAEGDVLKTGADGYVYVRTSDNGVLILRPGSEIKIQVYQYNANHPADTQIKFQLVKGVVRSISGQGAQAARDKYRFNTPVAAIGIRGTDFSVYADTKVTRASVRHGGIVMSPFDANCSAAGAGPCEGESAMELFAGKQNLLLQVQPGARKPELLDSRDLAPDRSSPAPANEERQLKEQGLAQKTSERVEQASGVKLGGSSYAKDIEWGRWRDAANLPAATTIKALLSNEHELVGLNTSAMAMVRKNSDAMTMPNSGVASFSLHSHESYIHDLSTNILNPAKMEEATFSVNFSSRTFQTKFNVVSDSLSTVVDSRGEILPDGKLITSQILPSAKIEGALAGKNANQAGFIYEKTIDARTVAQGATYWTR